jgi:hypothetical protein
MFIGLSIIHITRPKIILTFSIRLVLYDPLNRICAVHSEVLSLSRRAKESLAMDAPQPLHHFSRAAISVFHTAGPRQRCCR